MKKPINKWMVKVCHMKHTNGKDLNVEARCDCWSFFREELRRNVKLQASAINDTIKVEYDIVVPISKCCRGRHIALGTILEA